jgi:hypothetical protein
MCRILPQTEKMCKERTEIYLQLKPKRRFTASSTSDLKILTELHIF